MQLSPACSRVIFFHASQRRTARARELQRRHSLGYHDVITEDSLPPVRVSLDWFAGLFRPRPRILPLRRRPRTESATPDHIQLLVQACVKGAAGRRLHVGEVKIGDD